MKKVYTECEEEIELNLNIHFDEILRKNRKEWGMSYKLAYQVFFDGENYYIYCYFLNGEAKSDAKIRKYSKKIIPKDEMLKLQTNLVRIRDIEERFDIDKYHYKDHIGMTENRLFVMKYDRKYILYFMKNDGVADIIFKAFPRKEEVVILKVEIHGNKAEVEKVENIDEESGGDFVIFSKEAIYFLDFSKKKFGKYIREVRSNIQEPKQIRDIEERFDIDDYYYVGDVGSLENGLLVKRYDENYVLYFWEGGVSNVIFEASSRKEEVVILKVEIHGNKVKVEKVEKINKKSGGYFVIFSKKAIYFLDFSNEKFGKYIRGEYVEQDF